MEYRKAKIEEAQIVCDNAQRQRMRSGRRNMRREKVNL
jgi:hypothetical protein